jgi:hypothetical protein
MKQPRLNEIKDLAHAARNGDDAALGRLNRQAIDLILELIAAIEQPSVMRPPPVSGPWQTRSIATTSARGKPERKARVVSQANAARILGVHPSHVSRLLDAGHLEAWYAPSGRRMVTTASIDALYRKGTV